MKKKYIAIGMVCILVMGMLAGCSKSSSEATTTVTGEVASIGSENMVINVADESAMKEAGAASGGAIRGKRPDGVSGGAISKGDKTMDQKPEGTPPADMKEKSGRGFATTGEQKTIKISDDTKVTVQKGQESSEGTIADVSLGTIVKVALDEDGETAVSITVNSFGGGGMRQNQQKSN